MIDKAAGEFKCDSCNQWADLPTHGFGMKRVCKDCKESLEKEVSYEVDKKRLHSQLQNVT